MGGFLLFGMCQDQVRRPVTRFVNFYRAAQQARTPMSAWEKIIYGLTLAVRGSDS